MALFEKHLAIKKTKQQQQHFRCPKKVNIYWKTKMYVFKETNNTKYADLLTGKLSSTVSSSWGSALMQLEAAAYLLGPLDPVTALALLLGVSLKTAKQISKLAVNTLIFELIITTHFSFFTVTST